MPEFTFLRKGVQTVTPQIPTDTTLTVMPMTPERVGKEVDSEREQPTSVDSVEDAFKKFNPKIDFKTTAGPEGTEFVVQLEPRKLKDFEPENILKRGEGKRNDLADLQDTIALLYRLKDNAWSLPAVKRAWEDPAQRRQILAALSKLRAELEKVARGAGGGE